MKNAEISDKRFCDKFLTIGYFDTKSLAQSAYNDVVTNGIQSILKYRKRSSSNLQEALGHPKFVKEQK